MEWRLSLLLNYLNLDSKVPAVLAFSISKCGLDEETAVTAAGSSQRCDGGQMSEEQLSYASVWHVPWSQTNKYKYCFICPPWVQIWYAFSPNTNQYLDLNCAGFWCISLWIIPSIGLFTNSGGGENWGHFRMIPSTCCSWTFLVVRSSLCHILLWDPEFLAAALVILTFNPALIHYLFNVLLPKANKLNILIV